MRLLLDEMYPPMVAATLREMGRDVVAVKERPQLEGELDSVVLEAARGEGRVLVTEDTRLLWAHPTDRHHGVLFVSSRAFPRDRDRLGPLIAALDRYLRDHPADDDLVGRSEWLGGDPELREEDRGAAYLEARGS